MRLTLSIGKGEKIKVRDIEDDFDSKIVTAERADNSFICDPDSTLQDGDMLMVCIDRSVMSEFLEKYTSDT
ncbi:MAG: hypothetical protein MJ189_05475, partial [Coriobacteriales bacterium]|nr:hypothetical protein [Coriobacteriales bacterium]